MIEIISNESGDWKILKIDNEIFYEGHSIPTHVWLEVFESKFGVPCKTREISDEDMEERTFEEESAAD